MLRSLYSKLAAVLTGLFFLVGFAILRVTLFSTEMYQHEITQALNSDLAEHIVQQNRLIKEDGINEAALDDLFHMLMVINPGIEIYLLDVEGAILAYSAPPEKVKRERVSMGPVRQWLSEGRRLPLLGDDPRDPGVRKVFSAAPIPGSGPAAGYLYVILAGESYDSVVQQLNRSHILRMSVWVILGSLAFALITGLVLLAFLTGRLKRLTLAMDGFRRGRDLRAIDLPRLSGRSDGDEIDRLVSTFTAMAERIEDQVAQLKRSDALRREMIANVSHDLRTPLAMLRGYIETVLLKEGRLGPDEKRKYLEAAISHGERLERLVSDLFDLAKLDSGDVRLEREPFNIGELVQDIAQKFELKAEEKGVRIVAETDKGLPFVTADIGLIERVLENLLENALRHTPAEGTVRLALARQRGDVAVHISDTGAGIPEDQLEHIFERFYRVDKSRGSDPGHLGLGLAITRKILELHERTVEVASVVNSGTTFSFHLPAYRPLP